VTRWGDRRPRGPGPFVAGLAAAPTELATAPLPGLDLDGAKVTVLERPAPVGQVVEDALHDGPVLPGNCRAALTCGGVHLWQLVIRRMADLTGG
jgi:hypothetical protein